LGKISFISYGLGLYQISFFYPAFKLLIKFYEKF